MNRHHLSPRYLLSRLHSWVLWNQQGRPRDFPTIIRPGKLIVCPHGFRLITEWAWDPTRQHSSVGIGHFGDVLSARYPTDRVPHLDCCPACTGVVTV